MREQPTVLLTQEIDPAGRELLARFRIVERRGEAPIAREELLDLAAGAAAIVSMPTDLIDDAVLEAAGDGLRIVANHAVGVDNVDLEAASRRGVVVTNTPGVLTEAVADLTLALILSVTRRVVEGDRLVRLGAFAGWRPLLLRGLDLAGARLGIIGLGRIGGAVAERARAFGMEIVASGREAGIPLGELVATSDVVSIHCPLTRETHHLIGERQLRTMKPSSYLVNTARGAIVDQGALVRALAEGWIAGAALDVFEDEPRIHPALLELPNVVLTPHVGSATWRTRREMALVAARNVVAVLGGEPPLDPA